MRASGDVARARELTTAATVNRVRASKSYQIRENREYFERYLDIFESGVFYVERDELVEATARKRVRAYLAGGIDVRQLSAVLQH